jgi:hypothetical protein
MVTPGKPVDEGAQEVKEGRVGPIALKRRDEPPRILGRLEYPCYMSRKILSDRPVVQCGIDLGNQIRGEGNSKTPSLQL